MSYGIAELMSCGHIDFVGQSFSSTGIDIAAQAINIPSDHSSGVNYDPRLC